MGGRGIRHRTVPKRNRYYVGRGRDPKITRIFMATGARHAVNKAVIDHLEYGENADGLYTVRQTDGQCLTFIVKLSIHITPTFDEHKGGQS